MKSYPSASVELNSPKIGLMLLQADETLEGDARKLLPNHVEYNVTKMRSASKVSADSLKALEDEILTAASLFPFGKTFNAIGFACTSGSVEIGSEVIKKHIQSVCETKAVTNPFDALLAACEKMNLRRIAVLSPYVEDVNLDLIAALATHGIEVVELGSFNIETEAAVVRIAPESLMTAAVDLSKCNAEAIFISCTNLRTLEVIEPLEAQIARPILSSNQVLLWHLAQLTGTKITGPGSLFS